ncbi:hypothetical protein niasHT_027328 [Heterodera trifolii]|uniref:Uncharacterized protein n=1 Tax=Heterodera trifolii TaxID=157864 RepID=A0ABD2JTZ2_9BILA
MSFHNGLSLLILYPAEYQTEYGCANTSTAILAPANSHPLLAIVQLILAVVSEFLYALCMCSIWKHLQLSCYKILFFIGVVDMLGLVVGAILCSAMALAGATFCDFPLTQYITGGLAMGATLTSQGKGSTNQWKNVLINR